MARPLRVEFAGAFYHVMSRGNGGGDIFLNDDDRRHWLNSMEAAAQRCGWEVHAWVLMRNHSHALIGTPEPNLVNGMRWLQQVFTQGFNRRHRRHGHVLQGRYKAQLVESSAAEGYLCTAADYIHLNPARAGLVGPPSPENR